jgi:CHAT domain-containing protein
MVSEFNSAMAATSGGRRKIPRLGEQDINECYLVLANGDKMKLGDVYGLAGRYLAKVTVLSTCETALGRKDPGNEVAHLADGFVEAGNTTIVASLWQVSDASTATLMTQFYRELKAGKSKAETKQLAEIALLKNKETMNPYYRAPFVLMGDWR